MKGTKGTETKALIRETAFKLFLTKEYNMVPLKDIEQSLNLSRGCMSYHYPTKQELFMDVIDQYILRKQDVDNKMQNSESLSLHDFINYYMCFAHSSTSLSNVYIRTRTFTIASICINCK